MSSFTSIDSPAYSRLQIQIAELEASLAPIMNKERAWFKASDIFFSNAFYSRSDELQDYIKELKSNINRLSSVKDETQVAYLTDKISEQFSCFRNFLNSQGLDSKYVKQKRHRVNLQQRVKNIAQVATQSSQELYQELSKLQEYERRLLDMVAEKQQQLMSFHGSNKTEMQQHVLHTQQRLGRCRQAISGVEEKIQKLDSRN